MPTYEYQCKKCGKIEVDQKITDEALTKCPNCNCSCLQKIISATSFNLKGPGWAKDGYTSKRKK